jgi:hypothetical protein
MDASLFDKIMRAASSIPQMDGGGPNKDNWGRTKKSKWYGFNPETKKYEQSRLNAPVYKTAQDDKANLIFNNKPQVAESTGVYNTPKRKPNIQKDYVGEMNQKKAAIQNMIQSGDAIEYLGNDYWNQKGNKSMEDMLLEKTSNDPNWQQNIQNILNQKRTASAWNKYEQAPWYEKVADRTQAFLENPMVVMGNALVGKQGYLPGMSSVLSDPTHKLNQTYRNQLEYDDNYLNQGFNYINPGAWGSESGRNFDKALDKGNYGEAAGELGLFAANLAMTAAGAPMVTGKGVAKVLNKADNLFKPNLTGSVDNTGSVFDYFKPKKKPIIFEEDASDIIRKGSFDDVDNEVFFKNNVEPNIEKILSEKIARSKDPRGFQLLINQEKEYLRAQGIKEELLDDLADTAAKSRINELEQIQQKKLWDYTTADNAYHHPASNPANNMDNQFLNDFTDNASDTNSFDFSDDITVFTSKGPKLMKDPKFLQHGIYPNQYNDTAISFGKYHSDPETISHELGHVGAANRILPVEGRLRKAANPLSLDGSETLELNHNLQGQYDYFTKNFGSKRASIEPYAFAHETKQLLLDRGITKDWFDEITEETLQKAQSSFNQKPKGVYDPIEFTTKSSSRMLDFTHPSRYKMLAEELNKIAPAVKPITIGGGVLGTGYATSGVGQQKTQFKNGGDVSNLYNKVMNAFNSINK